MVFPLDPHDPQLAFYQSFALLHILTPQHQSFKHWSTVRAVYFNLIFNENLYNECFKHNNMKGIYNNMDKYLSIMQVKRLLEVSSWIGTHEDI